MENGTHWAGRIYSQLCDVSDYRQMAGTFWEWGTWMQIENSPFFGGSEFLRGALSPLRP
jgi:hypothetical protein